jgi:hypothetical protein
MNYVTVVSFGLLINGFASELFRPGRDLRQGFPLSPLIFLLVVEGLSLALLEAKFYGDFKGIRLGT